MISYQTMVKSIGQEFVPRPPSERSILYGYESLGGTLLWSLRTRLSTWNRITSVLTQIELPPDPHMFVCYACRYLVVTDTSWVCSNRSTTDTS
jgi:hypothetical protein